jgi:hypothetical protein
MKSREINSEPEEKLANDASAPSVKSPNLGSKMRSAAKRMKSAYDNVPQGWGQTRSRSSSADGDVESPSVSSDSVETSVDTANSGEVQNESTVDS